MVLMTSVLAAVIMMIPQNKKNSLCGTVAMAKLRDKTPFEVITLSLCQNRDSEPDSHTSNAPETNWKLSIERNVFLLYFVRFFLFR